MIENTDEPTLKIRIFRVKKRRRLKILLESEDFLELTNLCCY